MATELLERSGPGTGTSGNNNAEKRTEVKGYADGATNFGRRKNPDRYPEGPGSGERKVQSERQPDAEVKEIYNKFADDFKDDIKHLIDMRKRRSSTREFHDFLKDSGHSYYIDLFDKLTDTQEGTAGRADGGNISIDASKFKKFVEDDASMAQIYKIRQQKLLEQAMSAAAAFSENPAAPSPGMVEPTSTTLAPGGPIRESAREVRDWWGKARGRPDGRGDGYTTRRARIIMGTNGRLTLSIAGLNVSMGALGAGIGSLGGPAGAAVGGVLGLVGAEGTAALFQAMKKGVRMDMDISPAALQTIIGDPSSPLPENRTANSAQVEWMKEFNNLDPTDYEVVNGEVRRREGIVGMTGIDKDRLAKTLSGTAKELLAFQQADGIPPEHRQAMDPSWIFEGTTNRPQQGTEIERKIFNAFNPDQGGIRDINGETILEEVQATGPDVPVARRTIGPGGENATYAQNGTFVNIPPSTPLPEGINIPAHNDIAGNPVAAHVSTRGEEVNVPVNGPRLFRPGDVIPAGTYIPAHRRELPRRGIGRISGINRILSPRQEVVLGRVTPNTIPADHEFVGWRRFQRNDAIPAGTVIPEHLGPGPGIVDAQGNPVMRTELNPAFDRNQLDTIGNARRYLQAVETVLKQESTDVCQSLIDGKSDYKDRTFERFQEELKAAKDPTKITEAREKTQKKQTTLESDKAKLQAQKGDIEEFMSGSQGVREKIEEATRDKKEAEDKITITLSGGRRARPTVEEALAIVNTANRTVSVTIDGVTIQALGAERDKLKKAIKDNYDRYKKETAVEALKRSAVAAKAEAKRKATNLETLSNNPGLATDRLLQIRFQTLTNQSQEAAQTASEAVSAYNTAQERASDYYNELVRDPKDEELKALKAEIKQKEELVANALGEIKEKGTAIETQTKALTGTDAEKRGEASGVFTSMSEARSTITSWTITDADLRTKTFDDLLQQINTANDSNASLGWAKTGNGAEHNRLILLNAIAESRAADIEPAVRNPSTEFQNAIDPTVWAFSEVDLLTLSRDEIKKRMTDRSTAIGGRAIYPDNVIDDLKTDVSKRLVARQRMIDRVIGDVDHQVSLQRDQLKRIDKEGIVNFKVEAVLKASPRYSKIRDSIDNYYPEDTDIARFLGAGTYRDQITPTNIRQADTINPNEFYESALQLVFGTDTDTTAYYNGEEGTKAALDRAKATLPMKDFFDLIYRRFQLSTGRGGVRIGSVTLNREQAIINELLGINNDTLQHSLGIALSEGVLYNYLANIKI
jgi:hypothetical protein